MSFLFYFLILFSFSAVRANNIKKIESVTGSIQHLETDSDSNNYVVSDDSIFYKLNSQLELIVKKNIKEIFKLIVTPSNYVWIINREHIYLLKPNSTDIDHATSYSQPFKHGCYQNAFYTDADGNLLYNSADEGVTMMKHEAATPISIGNLENFYIGDNSYLMDLSDNIYLVATAYDKEKNKCYSKTAVIYSHELKNLAPTAEIYDGPCLSLRVNPSFISEFDRQLIVGYSGDHARLHMLNKDSLANLKILYRQPSFYYYNFHTVKNYFYYLGKNKENECFLNVGNLVSNDETDHSFHIIRQIKVLENGLCAPDTKILSDSDGTIFIASPKQVYRFEAGGNKLDSIFPQNETSAQYSYQYTDYYRRQNLNKILSMIIDRYENVWILGKGDLFVLKKGLITPERITNSTFVSEKGFLKINKNTEDIIVGCDKEFSADNYYWQKEKGLYVFSPAEWEKKDGVKQAEV